MGTAAAALPLRSQSGNDKKEIQYPELRWMDEREAPSLSIGTGKLAAKLIDNVPRLPKGEVIGAAGRNDNQRKRKVIQYFLKEAQSL